MKSHTSIIFQAFMACVFKEKRWLVQNTIWQKLVQFTVVNLNFQETNGDIKIKSLKSQIQSLDSANPTYWNSTINLMLDRINHKLQPFEAINFRESIYEKKMLPKHIMRVRNFCSGERSLWENNVQKWGSQLASSDDGSDDSKRADLGTMKINIAFTIFFYQELVHYRCVLSRSNIARVKIKHKLVVCMEMSFFCCRKQLQTTDGTVSILRRWKNLFD